jgi:hypothetical protein
MGRPRRKPNHRPHAPYPNATFTDAGLQVRLGEREWLLTEEEFANDSGLLMFPQSTGEVVMVLLKGTNTPVRYLSTDGTIKRYYFLDSAPASVLSDGSLIIEHDGQLVRLTPPA